MTAPATATRETTGKRPDPGDEFHLFCCDENIALCGVDLTHVPITDGVDETPCPMCFDLEDSPCACSPAAVEAS